MKPEEAMRIRNSPTFEACDNAELSKCIDEALEKQIAKKPIHNIHTIKSTGRTMHSIYCGVCGTYEQRVCIGDKYCRKCGNKIDWS